jgi:RHS repeat-associated protein
MASYKYDANGMRTEKTVNGTTTKYNIVGERVTWQQTGSNNPIYFLYDAVGKLWGLKYTDGDVYFYVRNLQGDIIKVVNSAGLIVVEYAYDAWGNSISTTGSMATTLGVDNPFRYRGYLLDSETGYFFVVSRYYDPNIGRFLNADNVDLLDGGNDHILENNLFTYCFNNPVNMTDEAGCWPKWVTKIALGISAVLIGAAVVAATVASGGAAAAFIGAAVTGLKAALVSGAIGAAVGAGTSVVNHRITTGSWDGSGKAALNGAANGFTNGFMTGGIMAGASQVLSGGFKVAANLGAKTGRNGGLSIGSKIKILSPNHKDFFESGGTLLKIGSRARNVRLDVGGRSLLHLNAEFLRNLHIPIGTIGSGIYGGIQ